MEIILGKKVLGTEIKRVEGFKNKLDLFAEEIKRELSADKEALEFYYAGIAKQSLVIAPVIPVLQLFTTSIDKKAKKKFIAEMITKSVTELFKEHILRIIKSIFIDKGIMIVTENGQELSDDFVKGNIAISEKDWDDMFETVDNNKIKLLNNVLSTDKALLSQILINIAEEIPSEKEDLINRIYAVDDLIMNKGYKYFIQNINEIKKSKLISPKVVSVDVPDDSTENKDEKN